jgi:O-antigen/teichoic acid export membrane protein
MLLRSYLSASQKFTEDAWVSVTDKLFVILVAGAMMIWPAVFGPVTINRFVIVQALGLLVAMGLALFFLRRSNIPVTARPLRYFSPGILRLSLPFALNIFFMTVIMRADGFLLERLAPQRAYDAGTYASAFRLNDAVNMAGYIMAGFLLPFIAHAWPRKEEFADVLALGRQFLMIPAVCLAVAAPFISPHINALLYHDREPMTAEIINVLFLCLPAYVIIQTHGTALTATGMVRPFMILSGVFALLLFMADLWVIPRNGAMGAAWVSVGIQNGFAICIFLLGKRHCGIGIRPREALAFALLASVVFLIFKYVHL